MIIQPDEAVKSAVGALRLKDIVLNEARFRRPTDLDHEVAVQQWGKRAVEFKRVAATDNEYGSLRIMVGLGIRFSAISEDENLTIYLEIEADFVAEYEIRTAITEDAIRAFAGFNAVHNVWPFWRQHVYDLVNRGRLRPIDIPLYSGGPNGGVAVSEASPRPEQRSTPTRFRGGPTTKNLRRKRRVKAGRKR